MKIKVFYPDRDGRISFTKEELENLLDEVYDEGYDDGKKVTSYYWGNGGSITTTTPYNTYCATKGSDSINAIAYNSEIPHTYTLSSTETPKYSESSVQYAS